MRDMILLVRMMLWPLPVVQSSCFSSSWPTLCRRAINIKVEDSVIVWFGVVDGEKMSRRNSDAAPDAHLARPVDGTGHEDRTGGDEDSEIERAPAQTKQKERESHRRHHTKNKTPVLYVFMPSTHQDTRKHDTDILLEGAATDCCSHCIHFSYQSRRRFQSCIIA